MLGVLSSAVGAVFGWFEDVTSAVSGSVVWIITGIVLCMIYRYLLRPLIGASMSDGVRGIIGRNDLNDLRRQAYNSSIEANNARRDSYLR